MNLAAFERAVELLPDRERMPGPKSEYDRMILRDIEGMWVGWEVERAERRRMLDARMARIRTMDRALILLFLCFCAGVLLAVVLGSFAPPPAPPTFGP